MAHEHDNTTAQK